MIFQIGKDRRSSALVFAACASMLLVATGCTPSHIIGRKIIAAPNSHAAPARPEALVALWEKILLGHTTNGGSCVTIPVGPPEATISAMTLPPRKFDLKFTSKVEKDKHGKRSLSLMLTKNTEDTFAPLEKPATVVLLHGYMMYKETMAPWALLLAQAGYHVVLVDLRGHGESTGREISFGKHETHDLVQVLDYLEKEGLCVGQVGVMGFSYGATMALHWAAQDPRVRTVVAIAPYNQPDEAIVRCAKALSIPMPRGAARKALTRASRKLDLKWEDWSGESAVRQIERPVLLIGAAKDTICLQNDIATLTQAAPPESRNIVVPNANHQVLGMWLHELGEPVKAWFDDQLQTQAAGGQRISGRHNTATLGEMP